MRTFGKIILIFGLLMFIGMIMIMPAPSNEPTQKQLDACVTLMWVQSDLRLSVALGLLDKRILASQEITDKCISWGIDFD